MSIKDLIKKLQGRSQKFKEMKEDDRLTTILEERKKSSNERELEKRYEKIRQDKIAAQLEKFRNRDKVENRRSTMLDNNKVIFKAKATVLKNNPKLFAMKNPRNKKMRFIDGGVKGL